MRVAFRKSFVRDLKKIKDRGLLARIEAAVQEVESAETLQHVSSLKKLRGEEEFYRLRIGVYRIGIAVEGDEVEFVRCLHRRDIYRYFP